jgi:hypothetical protein
MLEFTAGPVQLTDSSKDLLSILCVNATSDARGGLP